MPHYLRYPGNSTAAYTSTVKLNPSLVTIQEELRRPVQRSLETGDGTIWSFQVSANRRQDFVLVFDRLHEADTTGGNSGYTTLKTFFDTTVNYSINAIDLLHTDSTSTAHTAVKYVSEKWDFEEVKKGQFSGRIILRKVV